MMSSDDDQSISHVLVKMPYDSYDYPLTIVQCIRFHGDGGSVATFSTDEIDGTIDLDREIILISLT